MQIVVNDYVVIVKATDSQGNISNQTVTVTVSNMISNNGGAENLEVLHFLNQ